MASESGVWILDNDLCRCCHSQGKFVNLVEPRIYLNQKEVYIEILKDCFNIDMKPVPGTLCATTYTICDACITQLRDAISFQKQIQHCEKKFLELFAKNAIKSKADVSVKIEVDEHSDRDDVLNDSSISFDDDDEDDGDDLSPAEELAYDLKMENDDSEDDKPLVLKKRHKPVQKPVPTVKLKAKPKPKPVVKKPNIILTKKVEKKEGKRGEGVPFTLSPEDYTIIDSKYCCNKCDKRYIKKTILRYHVKTKHYRIPSYVCNICQKGFMTAAPLTIHKLNDHKVDDRINCDACKSTFNSKLQLKKHKKSYHMLGRKYKCPDCEYECYSFEGMYKHKIKHKTVKDFHCKFCKKSFLRKSTLVYHERIHTGDRRHICKLCSQAFIQKASLNYHMIKNHPDVV